MRKCRQDSMLAATSGLQCRGQHPARAVAHDLVEQRRIQRRGAIRVGIAAVVNYLERDGRRRTSRCPDPVMDRNQGRGKTTDSCVEQRRRRSSTL